MQERRPTPSKGLPADIKRGSQARTRELPDKGKGAARQGQERRPNKGKQTTLRSPEYSDDYQQIAEEAEKGGKDNTARGEDVGIERLGRAARTGHQEVAGDDEEAGKDEGLASANGEAYAQGA